MDPPRSADDVQKAAHGGGLARSVRPDDAEHRPAFHCEVEPMEDFPGSESLAQTLDDDCLGHSACSLPALVLSCCKASRAASRNRESV